MRSFAMDFAIGFLPTAPEAQARGHTVSQLQRASQSIAFGLDGLPLPVARLPEGC